MSWDDPKHPIWPIAKTLVMSVIIMVFVLIFAKTNASDFDETEIHMLLEIAPAVVTVLGVSEFLRRQK